MKVRFRRSKNCIIPDLAEQALQQQPYPPPICTRDSSISTVISTTFAPLKHHLTGLWVCAAAVTCQHPTGPVACRTKVSSQPPSSLGTQPPEHSVHQHGQQTPHERQP